MWLIRGDVRVRTTWPSGAGVLGRPGHYRRKRPSEHTGQRLHRETHDAGDSTRSAEAGSWVHQPRESRTEGVWSPRPHNRVTETDYGSTGPAVPTTAMRPHWDGEQNQVARDWFRRSQDLNSGGGHRCTTPWRPPRDDPGCTAIRTGSPRVEDAVSQCSYIGSRGNSRGPTDSQRQRPEICGLPGLFRVGSISFERLDWSTPDGDTTQTGQGSQRAVEDAVCIQLP